MTKPNQPSAPPRPKTNEEPDITQEESVPSDGKDTVGEKMIEELGEEKAKEEPKDKVPAAPAADPLPERLPVS